MERRSSCGHNRMWDVEVTDSFLVWYNSLDDDDLARVNAAVEFLERHGPGTGRPFVDSIHASRHSNMKELRPRGGHLRLLFAFDPRRTAILLIGGDKADDWAGWYERAIPVADRLYDEHLDALRRSE